LTIIFCLSAIFAFALWLFGDHQFGIFASVNFATKRLLKCCAGAQLKRNILTPVQSTLSCLTLFEFPMAGIYDERLSELLLLLSNEGDERNK
jgi:hypothetical protein